MDREHEPERGVRYKLCAIFFCIILPVALTFCFCDTFRSFILPVALNCDNERYIDLFFNRIQLDQQSFIWRWLCFKAELPDLACTGTVITEGDGTAPCPYQQWQ